MIYFLFSKHHDGYCQRMAIQGKYHDGYVRECMAILIEKM